MGDVENCCVNGGLQDDWSLFSYDKYVTFRDNTPGFSELAGFQAGRSLIGVRRMGSNRPAESLRIQYVSGNYFSMLGVGAYSGRVLRPDDDHKGADPVAVISYATWQQKFGQDPSVVGGSFAFNGQAFTVIGVVPPGFYGDRMESVPAFWLPLNAEVAIDGPTNLVQFPEQDWLDVTGRIAPGANPKQLEAKLQVELKQWLLGPTSKLKGSERNLVPKQALHLSPGGSGVQMMRDEYQSGLHLLMWVTGFVLLIACANVANLMLVRSASRRQHTAVRTALGASRARQITQVLTESALLAVLGGTLGCGTRLLGYAPDLAARVPRSACRDQRRAIVAGSGVYLWNCDSHRDFFGVAPAWMTARSDPADALRGSHRSTQHSGGWMQKSLVVAQAALSLVLLCAAGLLTQSLRNMHGQNFGFEVTNRYTLHYDAQMAGFKVDQVPAFFQQLHDNLAAIPGVEQVSFALYTPMEGDNWSSTIYIEGQPSPPPDSNENNASWIRCTDGYFESTGTKILKGRSISPQDTASSTKVAVVNSTFAKHFFKDGDPIGQHFGMVEEKYAGSYEIVGVTEDTEYWGPTSKIRPMFFMPETQWITYDDPRFSAFENRNHFLNAAVLKTKAPFAGLEAQARRALANVSPDLALIDFQTFRDQVDGNFAQNEMLAKLTSLFGILALVLASVGLYGVTAYSVERRTGEIGIRMALGADRANVLRLVLRGAFVQIGVGLAIGIPATILAGYAMTTQLFGVKPYAPGILLVTTLVLSAAALIATLVPARKAAALEPIRALRTE